MDKLVIRRYKPSDFDQVWDLHKLALKESGFDFGIGPWDDDIQDIESLYINRGGEFLVGLINDQIIVMGGLLKLDQRTVKLRRMRTHPSFQRRGFAQTILEALEKRAKELGFKTIILDTSDDNTAAQKLYIKNRYLQIENKWQSEFTLPPNVKLVYFAKEIT